ncbi:hypothetical protein C8J26_3498 [Sphingomonas aurantiaca]|jgi:hypothetical protein|uniref:Uncharacterized protein n=1 Tax=Sphingomonas aurantiaca TaxID=185949 RepID=A0A2T5GH31_9SPHN|nr:hypothetical protein [Sphingomonas aurantiaca]PTQ58631.1 hypothetical protein C8J26_3498 [Sphingomonas aurantiaca]
MEILRVPKYPANATVARLMLSQAHSGRVRANLKIEGSMSGLMEDRDHETVAQAEDWAIEGAEQRRASVLIIEDRT